MNGIPILGALPGSPAEECGLRYGDVLLSVNGRAMSTVEDFLEARSAARGTMELLVRRGDQLLQLTIDVAAAQRRKLADPIATMKHVSKLTLAPLPENDAPLN